MGSYGQNNTVTITQGGTSNNVSAVQGEDIPGFPGTASQGAQNLTTEISQSSNGDISENNNNLGITFQVGRNHSAIIRQNGTATYNRGAISQMNTDGSGGGNEAIIRQNNSGGSEMQTGTRTNINPDAGNWAGVWQNGRQNDALINQSRRDDGCGCGEEPPIDNDEPVPTGFFEGGNVSGNFAETWQQGNNNTARTRQQNSRQNMAEIFQGNDRRPVANDEGLTDVFVKDNEARINQIYSQQNVARVKQLSNDNWTRVLQNGPSSTSNTAVVTQGNGVNLNNSGGNRALVEQTYNAENNVANILQTGKDNRAEIEQYSFAGSISNTASITQTFGGSNNEAEIYQGGIAEPNATENNMASILQRGNDGIAIIWQYRGSDNNTADITQGRNSTSDRAYISQYESTSGSATIVQNQTATGGENVAEIEQTGNENIANFRQEGNNNRAGVLQFGDGPGRNRGRFRQTGDNNTIQGPGEANNFNELGAGGYAVQEGRRNDMQVDQTSTGSSFANTAVLFQNGRNNDIILNQTTNSGATGGNLSTISQNGNFNSSTITQVNGVTP
ncbi:hypothetical protein AWR27_16970 [Spirosoma montaniterrae]|uniref:Curlin n=1 Tax=Spirosoma montaniterrae TaxID=1178516 RepID=A0A1P9WZS0_9BACT|nr:hypothetical protein AWR27_16970 [Spirosoma montaniterrae]